MDTGKVIRILFLEDNPDDVVLIENELNKDGLLYQKECVDTREDFEKAIRHFQPDVVLSDHDLPHFDSADAWKFWQSENIQAPVILVTSKTSEEFAISSLANGAHDYILKSNLGRLPSAIRRAIKERKSEKLRQEAQGALRKQNLELMKANRELDNFVYSVSHNLRGPLASVLGLIDVANKETDMAGLKKMHQMMKLSVMKLDETLHEILDYSQNARTEILIGEIHWKNMIKLTFQKLEYLKGNHLVNVVIDIQDATPFFSDVNRMSIIFNNLLSNAICYSHYARELIVSVQVIAHRDSATVVIKDNGIGIEDSSQEKVFDMFFRGSNRSRGAGLGLYIVKEVVNRLNGSISLESKLGEGTTVTIELPNQLPNYQS